MDADNAYLIDGCRRGDRRAQKALYEQYAPMALGVCMRFSTDRDAAQDLMQDGFVRVYEKIGTLRDPKSLGAWIHRTMVNVCLRDWHRRRRSESVVVCDEGIDSATLPLDPFSGEQVLQALQSLPPAQRTAFNLIEVEGYGYGDAAGQLGCSEVNLRALVSRAKAALREKLKKQ